MSKHLSMDVRVPIEEGNPAIRRIESLCIKCGQCRGRMSETDFPSVIITTF